MTDARATVSDAVLREYASWKMAPEDASPLQVEMIAILARLLLEAREALRGLADAAYSLNVEMDAWESGDGYVGPGIDDALIRAARKCLGGGG